MAHVFKWPPVHQFGWGLACSFIQPVVQLLVKKPFNPQISSDIVKIHIASSCAVTIFVNDYVYQPSVTVYSIRQLVMPESPIKMLLKNNLTLAIYSHN